MDVVERPAYACLVDGRPSPPYVARTRPCPKCSTGAPLDHVPDPRRPLYLVHHALPPPGPQSCPPSLQYTLPPPPQHPGPMCPLFTPNGMEWGAAACAPADIPPPASRPLVADQSLPVRLLPPWPWSQDRPSSSPGVPWGPAVDHPAVCCREGPVCTQGGGVDGCV